MADTRDSLLEKLKNSYSIYFDVAEFDDGSPLKATFFFHSRSEKYVLVKRAKLWAAETHEYVYVYSVPVLTTDILETCREQALADGMSRIQPHPEHMSSFITALFLYDTAEPEALKSLSGYRKSKSFKLSLHGWMEYRIAAVESSTAHVTANRAGASVKKSLRQILDHENKK